MHLRVAMLLAVMALVQCDQNTGTTPMDTNHVGTNKMGTNQMGTTPRESMPDLLQIVKNGLVVIRDLFYALFGNVNRFRFLLTLVSELTVALFPPGSLPPLPEPWWGDCPPSNTSITPFRVHWSDEMISDLRERILRRRKITPSLRGAANTYGTNSDLLAHLLHYWAHEYDFKARENFLNSYPQYTTNIQGLRIHFIHVTPPNPHGKRVLPLLMLHGWPSNAFKFIRLMAYLMIDREDCDFVFEMIAPHLPGFGYSEATNKIGMANYQMGIIMKNLMLRLGFPRFYIHANGLGQMVADKMAVLFSDKVLGLHTPFAVSLRPQTIVKMLLGQLNPPAVVEPQYEQKMYPLSERAKYYIENMGYLHMHATRPDNVGHGIDDSPVAMLSWIMENVIAGAGVKKLLVVDMNMTDYYDTNVRFDMFTVSWDAQSMATSIRAYAESLAVIQDPLLKTISATPSPVPLGVIHFGEEIMYQPDDFIRDKYPNLVHSASVDFGAHTSVYAYPEVLVDHLWTSVKKMEEFHATKGRL